MRVDVDADCFAALMVLDRTLEPTPEPFRRQPDVTLSVNFEEYKKFISTLPADSNFLYFPTSQLQTAIAANSTAALIKSFYVDTALAVCKELFFAEAPMRPCGATVIRHSFSDCEVTKSVTVTDQTIQVLKLLLSKKGFSLPSNISPVNQVHWHYACKLLQDAMDGPTKWVEK